MSHYFGAGGDSNDHADDDDNDKGDDGTDNGSSDHLNSNTLSPLSYLKVQVNRTSPVQALMDTGSSINIISRHLYDTLNSPIHEQSNDSIVVANGQIISVLGTTRLLISSRFGDRYDMFFILENTSHPLILGTPFLHSFKLILNFAHSPCHVTQDCKVRAVNASTVPPNSESIIWAKFSSTVLVGSQGTCVQANPQTSQLLCARAIVTKNPNNRIPVKVFNPTNYDVMIYKGSVICDFQPFENNTTIHLSSTASNTSSLQKSPDDLEKFIKDIGLEASDNLTDPMKLELYQLLFAKRKAFVSKDNPDLGKCDIAEMSIRLKLDARPKHQKPYRLSPDKTKVLEHQLEHLLE
ncbi:retrovirus-related pol polyprotein from transposon [Plakobranchus ocellatus]|uniref:Retrovirus-related pol polyprotein from transposon n=1 Tax=Plakobranchus ocellatus TaxID=259542 RepID=A0AAV4CWC5_9GAST|nr:retrovirus-related pol polyprotein from transposon [Plakobranchus ocellatus]